VKLQMLSPNLIKIVNRLLDNKELLKLIYYNDNPLSQVDVVNPVSLINTKIFPYLYNDSPILNEQTQLRVSYGQAIINDRVIEDTPIIFECITHSNLYLINGGIDNSKLLRLYEMVSRITLLFDNISIEKVGTLRFKTCYPKPNMIGDYQMICLIAQMTTIGM